MSAWTAAAVMVAIGVGVGTGVRLEQRMPQHVAHAGEWGVGLPLLRVVTMGLGQGSTTRRPDGRSACSCSSMAWWR